MDLNLSQQEVAARASQHMPATEPLTQTTYSRMVRGKVPMRVDYCAAIAAALGMRFSMLVRLAETAALPQAQGLPVTQEGATESSAARTRTPRRASGQRP